MPSAASLPRWLRVYLVVMGGLIVLGLAWDVATGDRPLSLLEGLVGAVVLCGGALLAWRLAGSLWWSVLGVPLAWLVINSIRSAAEGDTFAVVGFWLVAGLIGSSLQAARLGLEPIQRRVVRSLAVGLSVGLPTGFLSAAFLAIQKMELLSAQAPGLLAGAEGLQRQQGIVRLRLELIEYLLQLGFGVSLVLGLTVTGVLLLLLVKEQPVPEPEPKRQTDVAA